MTTVASRLRSTQTSLPTKGILTGPEQKPPCDGCIPAHILPASGGMRERHILDAVPPPTRNEQRLALSQHAGHCGARERLRYVRWHARVHNDVETVNLSIICGGRGRRRRRRAAPELEVYRGGVVQRRGRGFGPGEALGGGGRE